jgi:hypothetical protein
MGRVVRGLVTGMVPRRPAGSTPEAGRLSRRGIGGVPPGSAGVPPASTARSVARTTRPVGTSPLGARASRPHLGTCRSLAGYAWFTLGARASRPHQWQGAMPAHSPSPVVEMALGASCVLPHRDLPAGANGPRRACNRCRRGCGRGRPRSQGGAPSIPDLEMRSSPSAEPAGRRGAMHTPATGRGRPRSPGVRAGGRCRAGARRSQGDGFDRPASY